MSTPSASVLEKVKRKIEEQEWAVINLIGPGLRQRHKSTAFRILGVFKTEELAEKYAQEYSKLDSRFDVFVVKMYEFLPIPTEVHDVGKVVYEQKEVNDLLAAHESTRTQTQEWNSRMETALSGNEDPWGMAGLN